MANKSVTPYSEYLSKTGEVGYVERIFETAVEVSGLPGLTLGEATVFESGQVGMAVSLGHDTAEILVLSQNTLRPGVLVARTGFKFSVPLSDQLLGRTVNALGRVLRGNPLDEKTAVWLPVDKPAGGIASRRRISQQMTTGVIMVDTLVPIGKGQRELIIGDRKTGKSTLLLQAVLNQARKGTVCVYTAIAKKMTDIVKIEQFLNQEGVKDNAVMVATSSQDSAGEIFLCPYTAMTIAEYFRDKGRDVLVVYDDLTAHAEFYRELSLLMKKFPGRESYPGDIFYTHSKLLERAGNFRVKSGEGDKEVSISCLPVAELVQGEIGGYIQTNLMSMTDGHIYFDYDLYFKGRRPAVNPFLSVTRVGRQTQTRLQRDLNRVVMDILNSYEKTQGFLKFGAELGENSRQILATGDRVLSFFNQPQFCMVPLEAQVFMMGMILAGIWDGKGIEEMVSRFEGDVDYHNLVLGLLAGCETMDQLMTKLRPQADILVKKIK